jgi:putative photosynthetic complex assembly protein 2
MSVNGWPILFALFIWWFSTGVILYLDGLPRRTFRLSMQVITVAAGLSLFALAWASNDDSVAGAYIAFTCALFVWGWHEMSFLMGFVTGPRTSACPEGATGLRRAWYATETILYHELAIALTAIVIAVISTGPNRVGLWSFLVLWILRISSKLNVFLGVPNLAEDWLPEHLVYLKSYFRKRPMNLFFPFAVTISTVLTAVLVVWASDPQATAAQATGWTLIATLLGLAVLEHWILVLPIPFAAIWSWGLASRQTKSEPPSSDTLPSTPPPNRLSPAGAG